MGLLSKDFIKLVGIAFVVAVPVAYIAVQQWLQSFAYRIDVGVGLFVAAGVSALVVAGFTVSFQSIRAAISDPVQALRTE